jgi:hypothetical protein
LALRRPPSQLEPELPEGIRPPNFARYIQPIFEGTCVGCHSREGRGPKEINYVLLNRLINRKVGEKYYPWIQGGVPVFGFDLPQRTTPGGFGARASLLWKHVMERRAAFSDVELRRLSQWLDLYCPMLCAYHDVEAQQDGLLVWPRHWDFDPLHTTGVERLGDAARPPSNAELAARIEKTAGEEKMTLLEALWRRGAEESLPLLVAGLEDPSRDVRACALRGLEELGGAPELTAVVAALVRAESDGIKVGAERATLAIARRMPERDQASRVIAAALPTAPTAAKVLLLHILGDLGGPTALEAVRQALAESSPGPANVAPLAEVSADTELDKKTAAIYAIDGRVTRRAAQTDDFAAWASSNKRTHIGATFTFHWKEPQTIAELVYYGRTCYSLDRCWKEYAVYVDDAAEPIHRGRFEMVHGPQRVRLSIGPLRKLTLKFLDGHGGTTPGASEFKVYPRPVGHPDAVEIFDTALAVLADWPDDTALDDLLRVAQGATNPAHNIWAVRAAVAMLRRSQRDAAEKRAFLARLEGATRRAEERAMVAAAVAALQHEP